MSVVSQEVLSRSFSRNAILRGYSIVDRVVRAVACEDGAIQGVTRGSSGEVYEQTIESSTNGKLRGTCTCPVGSNCKHCVAVLRKLGRLPRPVDRIVPLYDREESDGAPVTLDNPLLDNAMRHWLRRVKDAAAPKPQQPKQPQTQTLMFLLSDQAGGYLQRKLFVNVVTVKLLKAGGYGVPKPYRIYQAFAGQFADFISADESVLLTMLYRTCKRVGYSDSVFEVAGFDSERVLGMLLDTGKCRWLDPKGPILTRGEPRKLQMRWRATDLGVQSLELQPQPAATLLRTSPPRYVDLDTGQLGPLETGLTAESIETLLEAPEVQPEACETVRVVLIRSFPDRPDLWPQLVETPETIHERPTPILVMETRAGFDSGPFGQAGARRCFPTYRIEFDYAGVRIDFDDPRPKLAISGDGEKRYYARDTHFEVGADLRLQRLGLVRASGRGSNVRFNSKHDHDLVVPIGKLPDSDLLRRDLSFDFLRDHRQDLEAEGWRIEVSEDLQLHESSPEIKIDLQESGLDWFSMSLGFEVEGEQVDLLPILVEAIRRFKREGSAGGPRTLYHRLKDGRFIPLSAERLQPLVQTLYEWYGLEGPADGRVVMDRRRAADLAGLERLGPDFVWQGSERLRELGRLLASAGDVPPAEEPKGLIGELRPYQRQGLAWLQLLRAHGFGAVLADDMGLGKTIQTISHILVEKEQKRLTAPALIVAPTSTLPNWHAELARFAPSLRVVYAQGADRKKALGSLKKANVVLTTYPLLGRDQEILDRTEYHLIVLDEAQYIKNSKTNAWQAARELRARHRLCLTGTPMENHLGELWSLFEFLMPGFLGGSEDFKRRFRTPIEQQRNEEVRERLARRVRPFLLRRTKEAVAKELPPKTEVLERVELAGAQRDLYESLRLAMSKRVRDAIQAQGLARSQIVVLDALLKLRQACCDPRLVKAEAAQSVEESAKLDRLAELLDELRSEGRQTLVFSQFTSMLALIESRLSSMGIEYVTLTGDTTDRATPVKRFQKGEAPVFLISLKAGGTGLNLTAAETVIHYDPWWNPAVERQATDRAHRIGQTKPVFVHKLVATDTVEERILELQARKADLANALLEGTENAKLPLSAEDIELFFGE